MTMYLVCMLILNSFAGLIIYRILYKKRKVFNDRFGMIMSMSCSGVLTLCIAMLLQFLIQNDLSITIILTVIIGGCIGVFFGSLVKFQSLLSGFSQGVVGSLMGNMLGAVIKDPALCSLPAAYLNSVDENMVIFSLFGTALVLLTISLINYSLRV